MFRDLYCAQILGQLFRLGYEIVTTNIIEQAKELEALGPHVRNVGLKTLELSPHLVDEMYRLRPKYMGPSLPDLSALVLAKHLACKLVTRDSALTEASRTEGVAVRDTLWLLKKMVLAELIAESDAADALEVINDTRLRRSNAEWTTQIRKWRKADKH